MGADELWMARGRLDDGMNCMRLLRMDWQMPGAALCIPYGSHELITLKHAGVAGWFFGKDKDLTASLLPEADPAQGIAFACLQASLSENRHAHARGAAVSMFSRFPGQTAVFSGKTDLSPPPIGTNVTLSGTAE
jgi:hypothetical protein